MSTNEIISRTKLLDNEIKVIENLLITILLLFEINVDIVYLNQLFYCNTGKKFLIIKAFLDFFLVLILTMLNTTYFYHLLKKSIFTITINTNILK